jgi:hypothetical protein
MFTSFQAGEATLFPAPHGLVPLADAAQSERVEATTIQTWKQLPGAGFFRPKRNTNEG